MDKQDVHAIPDLYDEESEVHKLKNMTCNREEHEFKQTGRANEVKCKCGIGYMLGVGLTLEPDGHIYDSLNMLQLI